MQQGSGVSQVQDRKPSYEPEEAKTADQLRTLLSRIIGVFEQPGTTRERQMDLADLMEGLGELDAEDRELARRLVERLNRRGR